MRGKLFILTFLFLFFGVKSVFADSIVINEIMAKPIGTEKEWVELYNNSPSDINIIQWVLTELSSGNINSHPLPSIVLLSNSSCFFEFSSSVLNNDGDTVSLNNSSGTQIDSYTYTSIASNISGKTFSRIPDGGNWQTDLTDPTKSNTSCNNLLSSSPTPTPTSTPSPTPSGSTSSSFTISNVPSQINSDQSFSVNINLSMPNSQNTDYYLKGAFKKTDNTRYLGLTKIGNNWINYGDDDLSQYKITTDSSGKWTGNMEMKPDVSDTDFKGEGDYIFKVVRITSGGSVIWSNETTIKINNTATPSPSPTPQITPKISPSPSFLSTKPKSPTPKPSPSLKNSYQNASVAGAETSASESIATSTEVKVKDQKQTNPFFWIGSIFVIIGLGVLGWIISKPFHKNLSFPRRRESN